MPPSNQPAAFDFDAFGMGSEPGVVVKKAQYVSGPKSRVPAGSLIDFGPDQPKNDKKFDDLFSFEEKKNDNTQAQL